MSYCVFIAIFDINFLCELKRQQQKVIGWQIVYLQMDIGWVGWVDYSGQPLQSRDVDIESNIFVPNQIL